MAKRSDVRGIAVVLDALSDGRLHSGEALAASLGVSRAAVWKTVAQVRNAGYPIDAVPGCGYRWRAPFEPLAAERIHERLVHRVPGPELSVEVHDTVESTNTALRERGLDPRGPVKLMWAERQTGGRGRLDRTWVSPPGGLYFSVSWPYRRLEKGPMGFSVLCGTCVALSLRRNGVADVGVKWPNDLLVHGAKLGGILTEIVGDPFGPCRLVVGVGLNWWAPPEVTERAAIGFASLNTRANRHELAVAAAAGVMEACRRFPTAMPSVLETHWPEVDALGDADVTLETASAPVEGRMIGVDSDGALLLRTAEGIRRFHSGETRLRRKP